MKDYSIFKFRHFLFIVLIFCTVTFSFALETQSKNKPLSDSTSDQNPFPIPFTKENWDMEGTKLSIAKHQGFDSIYADDGLAILRNAEFTNGTIEFDILMQNVFSFPGLRFRVQDNLNFEEFYLRPFESGKDDATQYSPVYNGISGWQFYVGEGFTKSYQFPLDQWFHVKIAISGNYAEVYFGNEKTPTLIINELKREIKAGKLGLKLSKAYFANFTYTTDNPKIVRKNPITKTEPAPNIVGSWWVSNPFKESSLNNKFELDKTLTDSLSWTKLTIENHNGLVNIATFRKKEGDTNTVLAKLVINSEIDQIKRISIGFSDRVKVYFNDQLIFSGKDGFRSRDFRFLGTIGFFDDFYLRLKKGENTFIAAVSEDFGGWGIQGKFENMEGLVFKESLK